MTTWSKERIQITLAFILFFLIALFFFPLLVDDPSSHLILSVLFITIVIITFIKGTILGLIMTLFYIFSFGSALFFTHLTQTTFFSSLHTFSIQTFFLVSFILIMIVILAGAMHRFVERYDEEHRQIAEQFETLLTIDLVTGFDNRSRLLFDMRSEMSRAKRYEEPFTLIMLQIDHFHAFYKLYGELEGNNMIRMVADGMEEMMRISDRKYRIAADRFVLLLPHTAEEGALVVQRKLKERLSEHHLLNGKKVDLSYHVSQYTYDLSEVTREEVMTMMESELKSSEL